MSPGLPTQLSELIEHQQGLLRCLRLDDRSWTIVLEESPDPRPRLRPKHAFVRLLRIPELGKVQKVVLPDNSLFKGIRKQAP